MLKIIFVSKNPLPELEEAAKEYREIWDEEGEKIIAVTESISGLRFKKEDERAVVYDGKSYSHPLHLRANLSLKEKRGTLAHELCHILLVDNNVRVQWDSPEEKLLEVHKVLDLIFYDALVSLWGEEFARGVVVHESALSDEYKKAWEWALSFSKDERKDKFLEFVEKR